VVPGNTARYFVVNYQVYAMFLILCAGYLLRDTVGITGGKKAVGAGDSRDAPVPESGG
jgi:hypothetical protein